MDAIWQIFKQLDWRPLWISLKTGAVATVICFFLGIWAAGALCGPSRKPGRWLTGSSPCPCPAPTVAGFFLLLLFSLRRPLGSWLYGTFNIKLVQTWLGCIVAASVISFPLMYRNARAAFEQVNVDLINAGRTLGMSEGRIFWKITVPAAAPGIASGTVLTFARASGNTAPRPCWRGISPARREPSPKRSPWSCRTATIPPPGSGLSLSSSSLW